MVAAMLIQQQEEEQEAKREEELAAACPAHAASERASHTPGASFLLNSTLVKVVCDNRSALTPCFNANGYLKSA